jgi:hypothetical protein
MTKEIHINTPDGRGILGYKEENHMIITELGFVMLRVWSVDGECFTNYSLMELSEILPEGFDIIDNK